MATSPNFGWLEPDNTDLVKNGALAIRTLGDAIDASLVDLKGGTTGQVLAKASNTDMDFVWAADAGAPESLGFAAGKNKIINGDFYINQRNLTSTTSSGYGFDRWNFLTADGTVTYSAQTFTTGAAPVAGYEGANFSRIVTTGQTLTTAYTIYRQNIENVRTFAGQTATISFWAKANSGTPKVAFEFEQNFGTGGSPSAVVLTYGGQVTLSTSWARYSITVAVPSISGKTIGTTANTSSFVVNLWVSAGTDFNARTGSIGIQSNTFDIWGVQVEAGSVATAFQTATGTIQGELAACQRYYQKLGAFNGSGGGTQGIGTGYVASSTASFVWIPYVVTMRTNPSSVDYGSALQVLDFTGSSFSVSSVALADAGTNNMMLTLGITGATAARMAILRANSTTANGWVAFNAEL
jgi:hypothetical protein